MRQPASDDLRVTRWSAWVAAGPDRGARAERLAAVPAILRAQVRQEVVWWFERGRPVRAYRSSDSVDPV